MKNGIRWAALIAVLALAAGALAGAFALPQLAPQSAASVSDSREVPTVKRSFDDAHSVTAAPILSPEVSVLTSGGSGVVTASACAPGAEVKTGDPLVSINGVPRIAIVSTVPLWRDLRLQDKGTDVSAVQTALTASGYPVTASGTYDRNTVNAVKLLQKAVSVAQTGQIVLDQVQWIPAASGSISSCEASVGSTTSAGQPLMTVGGQMVGLALPASTAELPGRAYVAVAGNVLVTVGEDRLLSDPGLLEVIEASSAFGAWVRDPSGGVPVDIRLAEPVDSLGVPPSAVILADPGHGCVVVPDGTVVPVEIISSELGAVFVMADRPVAEVVAPAGEVISKCA